MSSREYAAAQCEEWNRRISDPTQRFTVWRRYYRPDAAAGVAGYLPTEIYAARRDCGRNAPGYPQYIYRPAD